MMLLHIITVYYAIYNITLHTYYVDNFNFNIFPYLVAVVLCGTTVLCTVLLSCHIGSYLMDVSRSGTD